MKILSIGQFSANGLSNTCLHRNWALHRICDVVDIDSSFNGNNIIYRVVNKLFRLGFPIGYSLKGLNARIISHIQNGYYDIVWIDKGLFVSRKTLKFIKQKWPSTIIVGYSPDNMAKRHNQSKVFLDAFPFYDYYVTTKSYTIKKLYTMGAKSVIFVDNAYEKSFHHPYDLTLEEKERLGGKIGFIGTWELERCNSILFLARNGVPVRVWGGGKWTDYIGSYPSLTIEGTGLFSEDYNRAISAFDISLCFLKKINEDLQTTRTMEIPACGSLLMAERTVEHERLFVEGKEAAFFSTNEELLQKCRYYLEHPEEREKVARAGLKRCETSGYSNDDMIKKVLNHIFTNNIINNK